MPRGEVHAWDGHDFTPTMSPLQKAYHRQRPLYVNLLDDLGASDFFVIDGDCLLLDCLSSFITDLTYGGQSVQLCYLVEDFLHSLQHCLNASFCIVFFQQHDRFWQGHYAAYMLLMRQLLQQHLRQRLTLSVHTFDNWSCQEWLQYVKLVSCAIHGWTWYHKLDYVRCNCSLHQGLHLHVKPHATNAAV